ncbi:hypothetical protein GCM10025865_27260 [Paraoerskovia sediminicola]|uniref:Uncharacterized protein n=1 Tax=Paraoerskovia sediminicola TaxID=1138587 RepID=A0ABM8G5G9_9CELL|nr:hypothetical protein GCM10025865_27260 [Paraoerskovia sediminicola]
MAGARLGLSETRTRDPSPLPRGWEPNDQHQKKAWSLGIELNVAADRFEESMSTARRRNWTSTFSKYLDDFANGVEDITFPYTPSLDDEWM